MTSPRVLVTGATGFLGRHLLGALRDQGVPAAALVRRPSDWGALDWTRDVGEVSLVEGTPMEPSAWQSHPSLGDVRTIFHTAAMVQHTHRSPEEMTELNVNGTLQMVRAAKVLGARLVFVSSSGTVGCFDFPSVVADENAPFAERTSGRWPYYASKIRAEKEARLLADKLGVELVIVRPPVLLGPGDHRFRSSGHVMRVLEQKLPFIPRGGMHFTDVRDAAQAMAHIAGLERPRSIYHLPGSDSTLLAFFQMVSEVSGVPLVERQLPNWILKSVAHAGERATRIARRHPPKWLPDPVIIEMGASYWGLSSLWSQRELAYHPRLPRQTLVDTVAWLRANHPALKTRKAA